MKSSEETRPWEKFFQVEMVQFVNGEKAYRVRNLMTGELVESMPGRTWYHWNYDAASDLAYWKWHYIEKTIEETLLG